MYEYPTQNHRPRSTISGHFYSPNAGENKKYFHTALSQIKKTLQLITTPAEITINAYLEMPNNIPPDEIILFEAGILNPITKPDYDNLEKSYTDMIVNELVSDDDIFYRGTITKYYSLLPRVEIIISALAKHESDYIYRKLKTRKSIKDAIASGQIKLEKIGV